MDEKTKLYNLYWKQDMTLKEIAEKLNWSWSKVYYRFREKYDIPTRRILWKELDFKNKELRHCLISKFENMEYRVNGERDPYGNYEGKISLSQKDFIEFCNDRKDQIYGIWDRYIESGKELKYALSLDRIDNDKGYSPENLRFVENGFNSWKDEITPIKIEKDNECFFFSSPEEASRFFDCRPDDIREPLRGSKYNRQNIEIEEIAVDALLNQHNCSSLLKYYRHHLI